MKVTKALNMMVDQKVKENHHLLKKAKTLKHLIKKKKSLRSFLILL